MTEQEVLEIKKELKNSTMPKESTEKILEALGNTVAVMPVVGRMPRLGKVYKCPNCERILTVSDKYCSSCGTAIKFPEVHYLRKKKDKED